MGEPYVVTLDQIFCDARSVDAREESLHYFNGALVRDLSGIVGDDLLVLRSSDVNASLAAHAHELSIRLDAQIVSSVNDPVAGLCCDLRITRTVAYEGGEFIERHERAESLSSPRRTSGQTSRVVLVCEGSLTGRAATAGVQALESSGVRVVALVLGVLTGEARELIESTLRPGLPLVAVHEHRAARGWSRSRDFVPFAAGCGHELSGTVDVAGAPVLASRGAVVKRCLPHLLPYLPDPRTWSSLTGLPPTLASEFSRRRLEDVFLVFFRIESRRLRPLTSDDLASVTLGASLPTLAEQSARDRPAGGVEVVAHVDDALNRFGVGRSGDG